MKRPRPESKLRVLENLHPDKQRQICEWLLAPEMGVNKVIEKVKEVFGERTNRGALESFYQLYVGPYLIRRREMVMGPAAALEENARKKPARFEKATIDSLERRAFEMSNNPLADTGDIKAIYDLLLKAGDQALKKQDIAIKLRRLQILERNAEKAAETLGNRKLSAAKKAERLREIFKK
jgi:hypothetical protein